MLIKTNKKFWQEKLFEKQIVYALCWKYNTS